LEAAVVVYAGIDVSKGWLDLALLAPGGQEGEAGKSRAGNEKGSGIERRRFSNDATGRESLVKLLLMKRPCQVVLEASGVYHLPLLTLLLEANVAAFLANPYQIAAFRKAWGARNKTDSQDAVLLARFAKAYEGRLEHRLPPPAKLAYLKQLLVYREQLIKRETMIKGSIEAAGWMAEAVGWTVGEAGNRERDTERDWKTERNGEAEQDGAAHQIRSWLKEDLLRVRERLTEVAQEIDRLLSLFPEAAVLQKQKGVGPQVAAAVLAFLPPALWDSPRRAASFSGLIPEQQHSGSSLHRSRLSKKGPALLRKKLYLAALVAVKHDPEMKAFYLRLLSRGKKRKQALLAVAHKLLRRLTGRLKAYYRGQEPGQEGNQGQNQKTGRKQSLKQRDNQSNERSHEDRQNHRLAAERVERVLEVNGVAG